MLLSQVGKGDIYMSMSDPVADMLTRIRNGLSAKKADVSMPASKAKEAIFKSIS